MTSHQPWQRDQSCLIKWCWCLAFGKDPYEKQAFDQVPHLQQSQELPQHEYYFPSDTVCKKLTEEWRLVELHIKISLAHQCQSALRIHLDGYWHSQFILRIIYQEHRWYASQAPRFQQKAQDLLKSKVEQPKPTPELIARHSAANGLVGEKWLDH